MAYCCSHITKSTHKFGDTNLHGRVPEFHRMSLRPGIGKEAIRGICEWLVTKEGARYVAEHGDIPNVLRMENKLWPIGKYLKTCIRAEIGMQDEQTDLAIYKRAMEHMANIQEFGYDYKSSKRQSSLDKAEQKIKLKNWSQSL
jgi:hypothetical protein